MCECQVISIVSDSATLWTIACQAPLSMGFSRQEYWSALPCPPPEDLPSPGIESTSLMYSALGGGSLPLVPIGKPICVCVYIYIYIYMYKEILLDATCSQRAVSSLDPVFRGTSEEGCRVCTGAWKVYSTSCCFSGSQYEKPARGGGEQ